MRGSNGFHRRHRFDRAGVSNHRYRRAGSSVIARRGRPSSGAESHSAGAHRRGLGRRSRNIVAAGACVGARSHTAAASTSRDANRVSGSAAHAAGCAADERPSAHTGTGAIIIAAADQL
jgi:hypothetical protein